ncbi:MAG: hypothetical protein WD342_10645 [Verrucomicrobiales bacterium]
MKILTTACFLLALGAFAGCGSTGNTVTTDPSEVGFETPSTMETQSRLESTHRDLGRDF